MDNYYVYLHIKAETGEPFYVGKGTKNRAFIKKGRTKIWNRYVNKYDYDVIILEDGLCEEKSFELEVYWIKRIGRLNNKTGPLINFTNGGSGGDTISNHPRKKEIISSIIKKNKGRKRPNHSKIMSGCGNPMFGKVFSDSHKENISKSLKGEKHPNFNKKRPNHSKIMSGGKNPRAKRIYYKEENLYFDTIKEFCLYKNRSYTNFLTSIKKFGISKYGIEYV